MRFSVGAASATNRLKAGLALLMLHIPDTKTLLLVLLVWAIAAI
jgi:hypothetical protein